MEPRLILETLLNTTPFPGWDVEKLYPLVADQMSCLEFELVFPYGPESLINEYHQFLIDNLSATILAELPNELGVTAKIRWMVHRHFEQLIEYATAERATISAVYSPSIIFKLPSHVFNLCDILWKAAGDNSIDMNYYSKRFSLGLIYISTWLYWYHSDNPIELIMQFFDTRVSTLKTVSSSIKKYSPDINNISKNLRLLKGMFWDK